MRGLFIIIGILFLFTNLVVKGQTTSKWPTSSEEVLNKRREHIIEQRRIDSLEKMKKEKIWDQAIVTESIPQPDGFFTVNIYNNTDQTIYVYINGDYHFALKSQQKILDKKYRSIKSIHAYNYDRSYKWGPINLSDRTEEDFFWKLSLPEKKDYFADDN